MTYFVSKLSVSQATTVINAIITFIQYSLSLSLAIVLVRAMPKKNIALAWSSISRRLNSTIWPTLLRVDAKPSGPAVVTISWLTLLTTVLAALAGVILPLGLTDGSLQRGAPHIARASYVRDTSALGRATPPNRDQYVYGRICGSRYLGQTQFCPAGSNDPDVLTYSSSEEISPALIEIFNSTPHGPFAMQSRFFSKFRQNRNISTGVFATTQSFIQRDEMFLAEGVVIDMSSETPGVGLLNHTVPEGLSNGGVWSQDVLWLEPITACVNTNLTVDYVMEGLPAAPIERFNLTDHGGFIDLVSTTFNIPSPYNFANTQADIDLTDRAFKAAVFSNLIASRNLSISPGDFRFGQSYPLNNETGGFLGQGAVGRMLFVPLNYLDLSDSSRLTLELTCSGIYPAAETNLTNIDMNCGIFLGPPLRVDGGDPQSPSPGSRWTQELRSCASSTRASIQRLQFSTSDTSSLKNIRVSRQGNLTVLWGLEQVRNDMSMAYFDPFWGRVDERFENDDRIWPVRSNKFYLPAGESSFVDLAMPLIGVFLGGPATIWGSMYSNYSYRQQGFADYSAQSNIPMRAKFRSLVEMDPDRGHAQIRNLIWTDIMANSVVGTQLGSEISVVPYLKSLEYDFRFATPGFLLILMWIPALILVLTLFIFGFLKFEHVRLVLNHTSVGRVVVGSSGLQMTQKLFESPPDGLVGKDFQEESNGGWEHEDADDWVTAGGRKRVVLDLTPDGHVRFDN